MKPEKSMCEKILRILFGIYLFAVLWIILFKMQFSIAQLDRIRSINLIPLQGSLIINGKLNLYEIVMNVVIFVPCGIYAGCLFQRAGVWKKILVPFLFSLFLEAAQFTFAIGRSDITDIMGNTLGGIIGLFIYIILSKLFSTREKAIKFIAVCAAVATAAMVLLMSLLILANLGR